MFARMVNSCLIINMKQISLFYAENVLKMRKMRKSANYADPHHRILSDALIQANMNARCTPVCQSDIHAKQSATIQAKPRARCTMLMSVLYMVMLKIIFLYAAKVINDRETGRSRGFGFVTLCSSEDVERALNKGDNLVMYIR